MKYSFTIFLATLLCIANYADAQEASSKAQDYYNPPIVDRDPPHPLPGDKFIPLPPVIGDQCTIAVPVRTVRKELHLLRRKNSSRHSKRGKFSSPFWDKYLILTGDKLPDEKNNNEVIAHEDGTSLKRDYTGRERRRKQKMIERAKRYNY